MQKLRIVTICCCLFSSGSLFAQGEVKQSREKELLRRQAEQIRQLESDKATLSEENVKLKSAADQSKKTAGNVAESNVLKGRLAKLRNELELLRSEYESLVQRSQQQEKNLQMTKQQQDEQRSKIEALLSEQKNLQVQINLRNAEIKSCSAQNQQLQAYSKEILNRLSDGTCRVSQEFGWDPVTRIGQVRFENTLEEYRQRIYEQKYVASQ